MKKWIWVFLLAATLLLSGCERETNDRAVQIRLGEETVNAVFDGTLDKSSAGRVDGVGLLRTDTWSFEGHFNESGLLSGTAAELPCTIEMAGHTWLGRYTGTLEDGKPHGDGSFSGDNVSFAGRFVNGTAAEGTAEDVPISVEWLGSLYSGKYTGGLLNGQPEGSGKYSGENSVGLTLVCEGNWHGGETVGEATVEAERIATTVEGQMSRGSYSGTVLSGRPEGRGKYTSVNGEGVSFTYEGEWKNGFMDGQGCLTYDAENYYVRKGTFRKGCYTPTGLEALEALGSCEPLFTLSEAQREFLSDDAFWTQENYHEFFDSPYRALRLKNTSLQDCYRGEAPWEEPAWIEQLSLRVIVYDVECIGGVYFTCITAADSTYSQFFRIIVPEKAGNLWQGQYIHLIGMPIGWSVTTNTLGEEHSTFVAIAADAYLSIF